MTRLSTLLRGALLVLVALVAAWLVLVAVFYRSSLGAVDADRPSSAQIGAMVAAMERATPADRARLEVAFSSPTLRVSRIAGGPEPGPDLPALKAARLMQDYRAATGERPITVSALPVADRQFPEFWRRAWNAFRLQVALSGGGTLVIDAHPVLPMASIGLPIGLGAGLFSTLVALGALIVLNRAARPLLRLAAAVERMDLSGQAPLPDLGRSAPEIRALGAAFARLQARLSDLLQARMALIGGIAHDVRTFATRLRLRLDLIPDATERARAEADIADMIGLLDAALLASRAGAQELSEELVDFDALVAAEVEDRRAHGAAVDLDLSEARLAVLGDRLALRRAVANLVDNALQYGQAAHLRLRRDGGVARLDVADDGPGIPPDQRRAMLEPFTRLEVSRNRRSGGAGLGLAVARSLIEAHRGTLAIGAAPGGGAQVTLTLPLFRADPPA